MEQNDISSPFMLFDFQVYNFPNIRKKKSYTSEELGMVSYGDNIKIGHSPGQ